ncbi:hypothetical protein GCM10023317_24570 [Actinopolymorpha pittospori]
MSDPYTPAVSTDRPATYSYKELAARIEQVLGERPSLSALRAAAAQGRRTSSTLSRPRLTVGMPAPLPPTSRTAPAAFSAEAVEAWLQDHPRLAWNQAMSEIHDALARGDDVEAVVGKALADGLSWRHITAALNAHDDRQRSIAGVHKRYRHLAEKPPRA